MSGEKMLRNWLAGLTFESAQDREMQTMGVRILDEHIQYDEDENADADGPACGWTCPNCGTVYLANECFDAEDEYANSYNHTCSDNCPGDGGEDEN